MAKAVPPRAIPRALTPEQSAFVTELGTANGPPPPTEVEPRTPEDGGDQAQPLSVAESTDRQVAGSLRRLPKSSKRGGRALFSRADGTERRKLSFYFEPDLAKQLHVHCVTHDIDMSSFVTDLVRRAILRQKP